MVYKKSILERDFDLAYGQMLYNLKYNDMDEWLLYPDDAWTINVPIGTYYSLSVNSDGVAKVSTLCYLPSIRQYYSSHCCLFETLNHGLLQKCFVNDVLSYNSVQE